MRGTAPLRGGPGFPAFHFRIPLVMVMINPLLKKGSIPGFAVLEFSDKPTDLRHNHDPLPVLLAAPEFPDILLTTRPNEGALPMLLVILECPDIL